MLLRRKTMIFGFALAALVIAALIMTGLLATVNTRTDLLSPRFTADGQRILFVERVARGIAIGPGIEFFTSPAKLHVFSDTFALKEMDLTGQTVATHFTWTIPREQFWIPAYRNHLFGYPRIDLDIKGDAVWIRCQLMETKHPRSVEHRHEFWYDLKNDRPLEQTEYRAIDAARPWHRHHISGSWEVMSIDHQIILMERFAGGESCEIRFLRSIRTNPVPVEKIHASLGHIRQRPQLEKRNTVVQTRKRLIDEYTQAGLPKYEAELKAGDDLEAMGLIPKSTRIMARRIESPLASSPVFTISDMEFAVGLFQDIDQAINAPGIKIRYWGNYISHRDYNTSKQLNDYLKSHREFQVKTSRGLFKMKIIY